MAEQHFVYGEYKRPDDATRAVSSLINASFEPDDIDVLSVRKGELERVPVVHYRPIAAGAMIGAGVGLVVGVALGITLGQDVGTVNQPWSAFLRFTFFGLMSGGVMGALGGLVWWRTKVDIRGRAAGAQNFIVGTTVPAGRAPEVEVVLNDHSPTSVHHYPVTAGEALQQHVERQVIPRL